MKIKKIIAAILALAFALSVFVLPAAATDTVPATTESSASETVEPRIVHEKDKTIVRWYATYGEIPDTYDYSEYDSVVQAWFRGTLTRVGNERTITGWNATFTGKIVGNI